MSNRWNQHIRLTVACAAAVLGLSMNSAASGVGVGCLPPTPSPCAADGICRPNRASWGFSHTRWRRWPGEPLAERPTPADELEADEETRLEPFERPPAEKENLRGPARTRASEDTEANEATEATDEAQGQEPPPVLPEVDLMPDFDPQGNFPILPRQDDAPPALPQSLQKASLAVRSVPLAQSQTAQPRQALIGTEALAASSAEKGLDSQPVMRQRQQSPTESYIIKAISEQAQRTRLVNPSALEVVGGHRQAIYYESTDRPVNGQIE